MAENIGQRMSRLGPIVVTRFTGPEELLVAEGTRVCYQLNVAGSAVDLPVRDLVWLMGVLSHDAPFMRTFGEGIAEAAADAAGKDTDDDDAVH